MIIMIIIMIMISMGDGFAGHSASGLAFLLLGNWFAVIFAFLALYIQSMQR